MTRQNIHTCDRAEAGHQLSLVNKKIDRINAKLADIRHYKGNDT